MVRDRIVHKWMVLKTYGRTESFFSQWNTSVFLSPRNLQLFASLSRLSMRRGWSAERCIDCVFVNPSFDWAIVTGLDTCKILVLVHTGSGSAKLAIKSWTFSSAMRMSTVWYPSCSRFSTSQGPDPPCTSFSMFGLDRYMECNLAPLNKHPWR